CSTRCCDHRLSAPPVRTGVERLLLCAIKDGQVFDGLQLRAGGHHNPAAQSEDSRAGSVTRRPDEV
ncbi:MAG: hypothetical protein M3O70_22645, partial [Actinomycetota bacterium]|nr:hypothetical protein [Actinomycetota bacterium]